MTIDAEIWEHLDREANEIHIQKMNEAIKFFEMFTAHYDHLITDSERKASKEHIDYLKHYVKEHEYID